MSHEIMDRVPCAARCGPSLSRQARSHVMFLDHGGLHWRLVNLNIRRVSNDARTIELWVESPPRKTDLGQAFGPFPP